MSYESQFVYKPDLRIEVITKASSVAKERDILLAEEQKEYIDPGLSLPPSRVIYLRGIGEKNIRREGISICLFMFSSQ